MKQNISKIVYPIEFQSSFVVCVYPLFIESFKKILDESGREPYVAKMFEQRLQYLNEHKQESFLRPRWIEKLGKHKDVYSLRIIDKDLNIRIPFTFYTYQKKPYAVLLSAFLEKNKSRAKSYSYDSEITLIKPIINGLEEVFCNGIQTD